MTISFNSGLHGTSAVKQVRVPWHFSWIDHWLIRIFVSLTSSSKRYPSSRQKCRNNSWQFITLGFSSNNFNKTLSNTCLKWRQASLTSFIISQELRVEISSHLKKSSRRCFSTWSFVFHVPASQLIRELRDDMLTPQQNRSTNTFYTFSAVPVKSTSLLAFICSPTT